MPLDTTFPIRTQLIRVDDLLYPAVCATAREQYRATVGVDPTGYPEEFVVTLSEGSIAGFAGVRRATNEMLQTARYCSEHRSTLDAAVAACGVNGPQGVFEVCTFGVLLEYQKLISVHMAGVFSELRKCGARALLLTQATYIARRLRKMGVTWTEICEADLKHYVAQPAEKIAWERRYMRVGRPVCCVIEVDAAVAATAEFCPVLEAA